MVGTEDPAAVQLMTDLYSPFVRTGNPIMFMDRTSAELAKYAAKAKADDKGWLAGALAAIDTKTVYLLCVPGRPFQLQVGAGQAKDSSQQDEDSQAVDAARSRLHEALGLLEDPSSDEKRLLGAWDYSRNQVVLHVDGQRRAGVHIPGERPSGALARCVAAEP